VKNEAVAMAAWWHGQPRWRQTAAKPFQAMHTTREGGEHPGLARNRRSMEISTDPSGTAGVTHAHARSRKKSKDLRGRTDASSCTESFEHHGEP
jgi:hypothetical protein